MASNTGRVAVRIPVEAEISNVSKTIEELKRALENVKPETKGYKQIESLLEGAEKKVLQIQKATASGLIDKASLRTLEKNFEDVFSSVEVAAKRLGNVNYENLKIPDSVVQSIKDLEQQMDAAKKAYTKLEGTKLAEVAASSKELGESLNAIGVNFDTDNIDASLDKTEKKIIAVREKIDELNESAQRNQLVAQNNRNKNTELQKLKDIFKEGDQGKKARAARTEFFDKNGNFKAGGKEAIDAYLDSLGLGRDFIEQVKKLSGSRLSELEEVANNVINKRQKSVAGQATKAQNEANLSSQMAAIQTADLQKLQALRTTLADLKVDPEVQSGFEAMTRELESLRAEVERLKGSAVEASGVGKAAGKATEDVGNAANDAREKIAGASSELERMTNIGNTVSNMKNAIAQWMGFYQVVNLVKSAVRNIISDIRELDKVMTEIAIVTNMTQKDLWAQMNTYQSIAREYGVSTKGVYEVSQLFYQQGLDSVSVMKLTTETLKMAKIAGLDYSTATDYMTVAIRGFHLEMDQAQNVVDVYSNIASKSASSTTELAEAMSKTASSAAAVGSSFENTTAMIAMMVETTRESASNIGSAMKSIISRYGEMKASPAKLVDSEGEELDFNKVDTALKSVGISMHTAAGQFRDFDDVILDLSKKWQTLDINTQRYIATVMAGNRQQSRFLALVSDYDRLSELVEEAANSQDAGTLQTLKTMDSLETKIQNVQTAWQGFYANLGLEDIFKGVLDNITNLLNRLNSMPKIFGKVPVLAIALVAKLISVVKSLGTMIITQMAKTWQEVSKIIEDQMANGGKRGAERIKEAVKNNASPEEIAKLQAQRKVANKKKIGSAIGQGINIAGTALSTYALTIDDSKAQKRGGVEVLGGALSAIGSGLSTGIQSGSVFLGILSGIASGAASVIAGINDLQHAEYLELEAAKKRVEKAKEASLVAKSEATSLESAIKKLKELEEAKYDSNEAYQEWLDYKTQIVETYPELLQAYSLEGEAILDLSKGYILLAKKREEATRAALEEKQAALLVAEKESGQVAEILKSNPKIGLKPGPFSSIGDERGTGLYNLKSAEDEGNGVVFTTVGGEKLRIDMGQFNSIFQSAAHDATGDDNNDYIELSNYSSGRVKINQDIINNVISSGTTELKQIYAAILYQIFSDNDLLNDDGIVEQITGYNKTKIEEKTKDLSPEDTADFLLENVFLPFISKGEEYAEVHQQVEEVGKQLALLANSFSSIITNMVEKLGLGDQERLNELAGKASTNKILAQLMMPDKGDSGFDTLEDWQASGDEHFTESAEAAIKKLLEFYNSIGDEQYDSIISFISHPEKFTKKENYKSELQNILNKFNVDDQLVDVFLKLADASWQDISESAQQNFQEMMAGNIRNTKTLGIKAIATNFANLGDDIAPELLSKLISQWGEMVNQAGTTAEAKGNAKFLYTTYNSVVELADTVGEEASQVVQGILANATLSTREGLQAAITALENYQKSSGKDLGPVIRELEKQRDSLIINLNTELQSYAATLNTATKGIAAVYKNQGSGFDDFEEMQKELARINASRNPDEQLNFSDVYVLDESLNKMIYTSRGLAAALATYQTGINEGAEEFSKAQTKKIEALDNASSDIQQLLRQDDSGDRAISVLQQLSEKYAGKEEGVAVEGILKYVQQGYEIITAIRLYQKEIENYGQQAEQLQNYAEQLTNEAQQIANLNAIDFASVIKGDKSAKITSAIKTWYNSLLTTDEGLDIIEKITGNKPGNIENMTEEEIAQAFNEFEKGFYSKLAGDVSTGLSTLQDLLGAGFDYDTAVSWYNAKIKASYDLLTSAFDKAPQEIIQLTEEQARILTEASIDIQDQDGIKSVTVQALIDSADKLWGTIDAGFQAGIISLDSYINAYKNIHTPLGLKNTRSIISNLNSYSIGTNITDLEIGKKLETLGYNLKEVRDTADNLIGYYIIDIPNNLREAYNQLYEDIVANKGTQSEQNDAWAKMMTANSASNTLDLISSAQKLTYEKFAEAANNAGKDAAELYQRYLNEGVIRIVNGQIQVVKINEFLEGMDIDPASAEYKQAVDEFNQAMASNYATLIKTNNRAAINAISGLKTSLTIDDFAQMFPDEASMRAVFDETGDIVNKQWAKAIKRVGPNSYKIADFDAYISQVEQLLGYSFDKKSDEYLSLYKSWIDSKNSDYDFSGFDRFLTDFTEVTYTQMEAYARQMGRSVEEVAKTATRNSNGTYDITNFVKGEGLATVLEMPLNIVSTLLDDSNIISSNVINYVAEISPELAEKASHYMTEFLNKIFGRTSKEVQQELESLTKGQKKFGTLSAIKEFNKTLKYFKLDESLESADYEWSETARSYILTQQGLRTAINNYASELYMGVIAETGDADAAMMEVQRALQATIANAADRINISQYLSSDRLKSDVDAIYEAFDQFAATVGAMGREISLTKEQFVDILDQGGTSAVRLVMAVAKSQQTTLSYRATTDAYRAAITRLEDQIAQLEYGIGSIVTEDVNSILEEIKGYELKPIGNGLYVITEMGSLEEAYKQLMQKMIETPGATINQINELAASWIQNQDVNRTASIISDAANMSFERLNSIFAEKGILLSEAWGELIEQKIISYDGSNIHILDLDGFFKALGIAFNSSSLTDPIIAAAVSEYNEGIAEFNRTSQKKIIQEVQNLSTAEIGDKINLAYLVSSLEETALEALTTELSKYGASLSEIGMLTLGPNANIYEIANLIKNNAMKYGNLLSQEMVQVADAVTAVLNSYVDIIKNGITGTLDNGGMVQLNQFAHSLNKQLKLDFTQTAQGLKLSVNSALDLIAALRQTNEIAANTTLTALKDSIKESQRGCATLEETLRTIQQIESQMGDNPQNDALKERLKLYQQIKMEQMDDPNSYNFMSRALPNGMQGAENYWNSWGTAFKAMNEAATTGYIGIQDFYNIVNEMNYIAGESGQTIDFMGYSLNGELTNMASLIQAGMSAIKNVDGEGAKIDLSGFGTGIIAGAEGMEDDVDTGIKAFARAQIKMLDAAIQMLEGIVALQELGKIDDNGNGIFEMTDIFKNMEKGSEEYTASYESARNKIIDAAKGNKDLEAALNSFKIGNITLREFLTTSARDLVNMGLSVEEQFNILKAIKDIDFENSDFSTIIQALEEALAGILDDETISVQADGTTIEITGTPKVDTNKFKGKDEALNKAEAQLQKEMEDQGSNLDLTGEQYRYNVKTDVNKKGNDKLIDKFEQDINASVTVKPSEDSNVDTRPLVEFIANAVKEALANIAGTDANGNSTDGFTALAKILQILFDTAKGFFDQSEENLNNAVDKPVEDMITKKEGQLQNEQLNGEIKYINFDGDPALNESENLKNNIEINKEKYEDQFENLKLYGTVGEISLDGNPEVSETESLSNNYETEKNKYENKFENLKFKGTVSKISLEGDPAVGPTADLDAKVSSKDTLWKNLEKLAEVDKVTLNKAANFTTVNDISDDSVSDKELWKDLSEIGKVTTVDLKKGTKVGVVPTQELTNEATTQAANTSVGDNLKVTGTATGITVTIPDTAAKALAEGQVVNIPNIGTVNGTTYGLTITPNVNTDGSNASVEGIINAGDIGNVASSGNLQINGYTVDLYKDGVKVASIPISSTALIGGTDVTSTSGLVKTNEGYELTIDTSLNVTTTAKDIETQIGELHLNSTFGASQSEADAAAEKARQLGEIADQNPTVGNMLVALQADLESLRAQADAAVIKINELNQENALLHQQVDALQAQNNELRNSAQNPSTPQVQNTPILTASQNASNSQEEAAEASQNAAAASQEAAEASQNAAAAQQAAATTSAKTTNTSSTTGSSSSKTTKTKEEAEAEAAEKQARQQTGRMVSQVGDAVSQVSQTVGSTLVEVGVASEETAQTISMVGNALGDAGRAAGAFISGNYIEGAVLTIKTVADVAVLATKIFGEPTLTFEPGNFFNADGSINLEATNGIIHMGSATVIDEVPAEQNSKKKQRVKIPELYQPLYKEAKKAYGDNMPEELLDLFQQPLSGYGLANILKFIATDTTTLKGGNLANARQSWQWTRHLLKVLGSAEYDDVETAGLVLYYLGNDVPEDRAEGRNILTSDFNESAEAISKYGQEFSTLLTSVIASGEVGESGDKQYTIDLPQLLNNFGYTLDQLYELTSLAVYSKMTDRGTARMYSDLQSNITNAEADYSAALESGNEASIAQAKEALANAQLDYIARFIGTFSGGVFDQESVFKSGDASITYNKQGVRQNNKNEGTISTALESTYPEQILSALSAFIQSLADKGQLTEAQQEQASNDLQTLNLSELEGYLTQFGQSVQTFINWIDNTGSYTDEQLKEKIIQYTANTKEVEQQVEETESSIEDSSATLTVEGDTTPAEEKTQEARASIENNPATLTVNTRVNRASVDQLMYDLRDLNSITTNPKTGTPLVGTTIMASATGNVALAGGRGTLMGELGPELYVTNGHYYVAGQNGAEFVNLPDDAIVFNHLQTQRLLENGHAGRGRVVTNERKATSLATGNTSGPAMASAAAVLAQLKQIRAMWDAMLNASVADLGSKAGLGKKGGGGGGGKNNDKTNTVKLDSGYIRDLERWYNLLRQIEKLEQDINYEEKLRSKLEADSIANGKLIYESQRRSYESLQKELDRRVELAELKKGYYEQEMEEVKSSPWGQIFYFDDEGTIQMKGMDFLANVFANSQEGGAVHSAREQYQMLVDAGYGSLLQYKDDGSKVEWNDSEGNPREEAYKEAVEAFSAKMDSQKEELEGLREDYMNEMESILDVQIKQNEILTAIRENTIAVEQEVLDAILSAREREIEELQNQRDAIQDSSDKFINGLTDELNKERDMYNQQQEDKELAQLYRQLGILQRSGASASQIRSIQDQISQKEQDAYFEGQQKQIDAIKEASDLQLERLDAQISLMSETLEYQKAHGLLWDQVYQVMQLSESEIADFITTQNPDWWSKSMTQRSLDMVELGNKIQQWTAYRDDISDTKNAITNAINNGITAITSVVARTSPSQQYTVSGTGGYTTTSSSGTGSGGSGGTSSTSGKTGGSSGKTNAVKIPTANVGGVVIGATSMLGEHGYSFTYHGQYYSQQGFASKELAAEAARKRLRALGGTQHDTSSYNVYGNGGLIDYTGPAWVDGTKKKPEGILNAEQLDMLRNSVLTRKNPVAALLADYQGIVSDTAGSSAYNSINQNNGVNVERIELNMNVSKMSNDYDARRAADTMMDEVIRIARKSGATSVSRR